MVTSFYHGERNHYGFFTQVSNLILQSTNGYSFDYVTNTLMVTKAFLRKAQEDQNSSEYRTIAKFKRDFRDVSIITRPTPKRKNTSARLTYDKMVKYLSCQPDSERLLLMFNQVREESKSKSASYQFVRQWFLQNFPEYFRYPSFDEYGKMINPRGTAKMETSQKTTTIDFSNTAA